MLGCECVGAALDFLFADCLLASLRLKGSEGRLLLFECLLARLKCEGAALDCLFAACLVASLRLKGSECKPLLFGCLLARL